MDVSKASSGAIMSAVDTSLAVPRPMVLKHLERLAARYPDDPARLQKALERELTSSLTTAGAAVGGAAAVPGVGTALAMAANVSAAAGFFGASALYVLALAELHGLEVDDIERRRTLLLAVLLGNSGSRTIEKVAGRTGKHWGRWVTQNASREAIKKVNALLGARFITINGTQQGVLVLGRAAPFGIGVAIGGLGNLALARGVVASARRAFGDPPAAVGAWRNAA